MLEPEQHKILVDIARCDKQPLPDVVISMLVQQIEDRKKLDFAIAATD